MSDTFIVLNSNIYNIKIEISVCRQLLDIICINYLKP